MTDAARGKTEVRLDGLERFAVAAENQLQQVKETLAAQGAKLDQIVQAVTLHSAQPKIDLFRIVGFIALVVGIFASTVGGITYIASNINAGPDARQDERMRFLELRMERGWLTTQQVMRAGKADAQ